MEKKQSSFLSDESFGESPSKKHKKHKKHKHKKRTREERQPSMDGEDSDEDVKPIKLKIKFGSFSTKESKSSTPAPEEAQSSPSSSKNKVKKEKVSEVSKVWKAKEDVFRTKRSDEDTSDEEKQWLDALEKGTLDDKGELKRSKDLSLMTARQRALIHGIKEEPLMQLPTGYKPPEFTEEQLEKRQQKAKQRREVAAKKQEKAKKKTLARLLTKQDSKPKGPAPKAKPSRRGKHPGFRYVQNQNSISVSVPEGRHFPLVKQTAPPPPAEKLCGVSGCTDARRYTCSQTGVPLCSLRCYKLNLSAHAPPLTHTEQRCT